MEDLLEIENAARARAATKRSSDSGGPLRVLIVEDNPADVYLLKESLSAIRTCEFRVIDHGDDAYRFLSRPLREDKGERPRLVVLDLNLPGRDGVEVLNLIRAQPDLRDLVVAVVSSSPRDVIRRKAAEADCYIAKPSDFEAFMAVGRELLQCLERTEGWGA